VVACLHRWYVPTRTSEDKGDRMRIKQGIGLAVVLGLLTASVGHAEDKVSIRLKWLHQAQFAG
jgi:hypothetical protein